MDQRYASTYDSFSSNRSPSTSRFNPTINRQSSRHFEQGSIPGFYPSSENQQQRLFNGASNGQPLDRNDGSQYGYDVPPVPSLNTHVNPFSNYFDGSDMSLNRGAHTISGGRPRNNRAIPVDMFALPQTAPLTPQSQPWASERSHNGTLGGWNDYPDSAQHNLRQGVPAPKPFQGRTQNLDANGEIGEPEALIPTAIVIKNIPFAVKKEQLLSIMSEMDLPLPYAFNYHFDQGVFRGLAFANFSTAEETADVIARMNHLDLVGRKLRVEYKRMLPAEDRERIEREKRQKRGQLQEQHENNGTIMLHAQASVSSLGSHRPPAISPSPVSQRTMLGNDPADSIDYNNRRVRELLEQVMAFKYNPDRPNMVMDIGSDDRRIVHILAQENGLEHRSEGDGDRRYLVLTRKTESSASATTQYYEPHTHQQPRTLNRSATTDLSSERDRFNGGLSRQPSTTLMPFNHTSPGNEGANHGSVRAAKSFGDLKGYRSTSSFQAEMNHYPSNRFYDGRPIGGTTQHTPTSAEGYDDAELRSLTNGVNNMTLPTPIGGRISTRPNHETSTAGPIGSQRPNGNYNESASNGTSSVPQRQPTLPPMNGSTRGFARGRNGHAQRGSDSSDSTGPSRGRHQ